MLTAILPKRSTNLASVPAAAINHVILHSNKIKDDRTPVTSHIKWNLRNKNEKEAHRNLHN